jgi:hypothetical protein
MRELPITLISPDDVQAALLDMDKYEQSVQEAAVRKDGAPVLPPTAALVRLLPDKLTPESLAELRTWLAQQMQKNPVARLVLPAIPTMAYKEAVIRWLRQEIAPNIMLDVEINRELAGGFQLWLGGKMFDFSFRQPLLDNHTKLVELYRGR